VAGIGPAAVAAVTGARVAVARGARIGNRILAIGAAGRARRLDAPAAEANTRIQRPDVVEADIVDVLGLRPALLLAVAVRQLAVRTGGSIGIAFLERCCVAILTFADRVAPLMDAVPWIGVADSAVDLGGQDTIDGLSLSIVFATP